MTNIVNFDLDGITYDVEIVSINLDTEFLYKYAERTEDFNLRYELGGVFFNQSITFGVGKSNSDFSNLWDVLSDKSKIDNGTGHRLRIFTPIGRIELIMYPDKISLSLLKLDKSDSYWTGMKVNFIGVKPARS